MSPSGLIVQIRDPLADAVKLRRLVVVACGAQLIDSSGSPDATWRYSSISAVTSALTPKGTLITAVPGSMEYLDSLGVFAWTAGLIEKVVIYGAYDCKSNNSATRITLLDPAGSTVHILSSDWFESFASTDEAWTVAMVYLAGFPGGCVFNPGQPDFSVILEGGVTTSVFNDMVLVESSLGPNCLRFYPTYTNYDLGAP